MKGFPQIPLLLAFSACVGSTLGINPASAPLQKRQFSRERSGEIIASGSGDKSVIASRLKTSHDKNNTVHSNCSCAMLDPSACVEECGYFGHGGTHPGTGKAYELIPNNAFYRDGDYDWPEPLEMLFYHSGGAQQSYIATGKDDNPYFDYPPKQLNASEAAELYPGEGNWPDVVYAWWFLFTSNHGRPSLNDTWKFQPVTCLCEAARECGCAPAGWTTVEAFTNMYAHNAVITSTRTALDIDWIVNGTATALDLEEQSKLRAQNEADEEDDESGASKNLGGSGWSVLALIAVAMFSGL